MALPDDIEKYLRRGQQQEAVQILARRRGIDLNHAQQLVSSRMAEMQSELGVDLHALRVGLLDHVRRLGGEAYMRAMCGAPD